MLEHALIAPAHGRLIHLQIHGGFCGQMHGYMSVSKAGLSNTQIATIALRLSFSLLFTAVCHTTTILIHVNHRVTCDGCVHKEYKDTGSGNDSEHCAGKMYRAIINAAISTGTYFETSASARSRDPGEFGLNSKFNAINGQTGRYS